MVKWLRRRVLSAESRVRFPVGLSLKARKAFDFRVFLFFHTKKSGDQITDHRFFMSILNFATKNCRRVKRWANNIFIVPNVNSDVITRPATPSNIKSVTNANVPVNSWSTSNLTVSEWSNAFARANNKPSPNIVSGITQVDVFLKNFYNSNLINIPDSLLLTARNHIRKHLF